MRGRERHKNCEQCGADIIVYQTSARFCKPCVLTRQYDKVREALVRRHIQENGTLLTVSRFLIYALSDPRDGAIRYVGKSTTGLTRPYCHLRRTSEYYGKTYKCKWVRHMAALGLVPVVEVLEELTNANDLIEAECFWITQVRSWGFRLTNLSEGGLGPKGVAKTGQNREVLRERLKQYAQTETGRADYAARAAKRRGKKKSPAAIAKFVASVTGRKRTPEQRHRMRLGRLRYLDQVAQESRP